MVSRGVIARTSAGRRPIVPQMLRTLAGTSQAVTPPGLPSESQVFFTRGHQNGRHKCDPENALRNLAQAQRMLRPDLGHCRIGRPVRHAAADHRQGHQIAHVAQLRGRAAPEKLVEQLEDADGILRLEPFDLGVSQDETADLPADLFLDHWRGAGNRHQAVAVKVTAPVDSSESE